MNKHVIIGTAGHVDHGKTSLIKALTGFDCDTHKEEKERGITINLGFTHIDFSSGDSAGIVDVPGHKDFIKTMISGASGIDVVLLVIAADSGIMPQTREHLNIIEMLGIEHGIVALTKSDLVDEEMIELAKLEIMEFLENSKLQDAQIIEVSSVTGKGINELKDNLESLIKIVPAKKTEGLFRIYIDRVFNVVGKGCVVTGSVMNGKLKTGSDLYLLPGRERKAKAKSMQRHGEEVETIQAGDRAAINLSGVKVDEFERGMILCDRKLDEVSMLDVVVELFEENTSLGLWSDVLFHTGSFATKARLHLINIDELKTGMKGLAQVHLDKPAIILNGDKFIIRNTSNDLTLGGGTIIDDNPLHHKRRTQKVIEYLEKLAEAKLNNANIGDLIISELKKANKPLVVSELAKILSQSEEEIIEASELDNNELYVFDIDKNKLIIDSLILDEIKESILDRIDEFHKNNPLLNEGLSLQALIGKLNVKSINDSKLISLILNDLRNNRKVKQVKSTWALQNHEAKFDQKIESQLKWIEAAFEKCGMELPILQEVEKRALNEKISSVSFKSLVKSLTDNKKLYAFQGNLIHAKIIDEARRKLIAELKTKPQGINEKEARELLGSTKKMLQVLLSIFIEEGIVEKKTFYIHLVNN